jgi:capsular polysaccharide biosynthesis protein
MKKGLANYRFTNIEVTFDGICVLDNVIVGESIYYYRDTFEDCELTVSLINKSRFLPAGNYVVAHSSPCNIFHWITDSVPRLIRLKKSVTKSTLLLPQRSDREPFIKETLKVLGIKKRVFISRTESVRAPHLTLPETNRIFTNLDATILRDVRKKFLNSLSPKRKNAGTTLRKIFLSTTLKENYIVVNKKNVSQALKDLGFHILDPRKTGFMETIAFIQHAEVLIGFSTPDLVFLNFLPSNASLLELRCPPGNVVDKYLECYEIMAHRLSLQYNYQYGTHIGYVGNEAVKAIEFDIRALMDIVNKKIKRPSKKFKRIK